MLEGYIGASVVARDVGIDPIAFTTALNCVAVKDGQVCRDGKHERSKWILSLDVAKAIRAALPNTAASRGLTRAERLSRMMTAILNTTKSELQVYKEGNFSGPLPMGFYLVDGVAYSDNKMAKLQHNIASAQRMIDADATPPADQVIPQQVAPVAPVLPAEKVDDNEVEDLPSYMQFVEVLVAARFKNNSVIEVSAKSLREAERNIRTAMRCGIQSYTPGNANGNIDPNKDPA